MQHCNTHHTSQEQGYQHQTVAGSREVKCSLVSSIKVSFQWGGMTTPCTARNTWAISPQQLSKFTQILLSSHHLECTATSISISISSLRTLLLLTLPETYGTTLLPSSHCAASASYHNYSQYGTSVRVATTPTTWSSAFSLYCFIKSLFVICCQQIHSTTMSRLQEIITINSIHHTVFLRRNLSDVARTSQRTINNTSVVVHCLHIIFFLSFFCTSLSSSLVLIAALTITIVWNIMSQYIDDHKI